MSIIVETAPYRTGVPGLMSCISVIIDRTSALCCTIIPASVTGPVAPAIISGEGTTICLSLVYSIIPSIIGLSGD